MSRPFPWSVPVLTGLCTALGLGAGWWIAQKGAAPAPAAEEELEHEHEEEHALSPATLENLGVRVGTLETSSWTRTLPVTARVAITERSDRPVFAPAGGRVESIAARVGDVIEPGSRIVRLLRDPLPLPTLTLTLGVLNPAQENLHEAVHQLHVASHEVSLVRTELDRVAAFSEVVGEETLPVLPGQRLIELRQELLRAERAQEEAEHELRKHGFDAAQIAQLRDGDDLPTIGPEQWMRALERNGLWTAEADRLLATLPEPQRSLPWVVATIAELGASGLATKEFSDWLEREPDVAQHFLALAAMRQAGHSIADLRSLHAQGAFEDQVEVQAPKEAAASFDLQELRVRLGESVAAGATLAVLRDPTTFELRAEPVGAEIVALLEARRSGRLVSARPLVEGSAPTLGELRITRVVDAHESHETVAWIPVPNEPWGSNESTTGARTWQLREGMPFVVEVPVEVWDEVFVLPAGAVTTRGPDRVVFLRSGDHFDPTPVVVLHEDSEVVVLPATGRSTTLFEGDEVVLEGAFALGLALRTDTGGDAGHGHHH